MASGTDRASIATETKVTKLLKEKNINKKEIGRDKFLEHSWEWKEKYSGTIIKQLKRLGCSCDWSKEDLLWMINITILSFNFLLNFMMMD